MAATAKTIRPLEGVSWNSIKVFSATKHIERQNLGETITAWLRNQGDIEIIEKVVTQSSDSEFHCLTITLFYRGAS